jgi:Nucleotidyl transferase AbiEii toxin, Type IV TA system
VARPVFRVYPRETHVAEKLHAYTLPRGTENSRVKDLPDIALLARTGTFDGTTLRRAIESTFSFRKSHALPPSLPAPPESWGTKYARMAKTDALPWAQLDHCFQMASAFLDPILSGRAKGQRWDPDRWHWT